MNSKRFKLNRNDLIKGLIMTVLSAVLGTASGSQTITVTGNPGAGTCNTSIATAKGFTVVT